MTGAFVLAHVAIKTLNVVVVDVGKMSLQIIFMCFLANCARAPLKFARFNNFRIGNIFDYGQVDLGSSVQHMTISFHGDRVTSQKTMAANKKQTQKLFENIPAYKNISLHHCAMLFTWLLPSAMIKIIGFMS